MAGSPAIIAFAVFEHREIDNPQWSPCFVEQAVCMTEVGIADFVSQGTHGIVDDPCLVGTEENQVAIFGTGAFKNLFDGFFRQVLDDRRL